MEGFCVVAVNPLGPVQLYSAPGIVLAVKFRAVPVQTGLLLPATGVAGVELMVAATVPAGLVHPLTVTITE